MRLGDCYRPEFTYDRTAPRAQAVLRTWLRDFKFLPITTSEPEALGRLIQQLIWKQSEHSADYPVCGKHALKMVLLGEPGFEWRAPKKCRGMSFWNPGNGKVVVSRGLFRCPHPGCYRVGARPEQGVCGIIGDTSRKYPPCPRYRSHVFPGKARRCPCGFVR